MPEIYLNIIVALSLYAVIYLIRNKYSDRVPVSVRRGIYCAGILFFIFITVYYFNNPMSQERHVISFAINAGLIGYFVYKLFSLKNENGVKAK
jgi:hypothetical protein